MRSFENRSPFKNSIFAGFEPLVAKVVGITGVVLSLIFVSGSAVHAESQYFITIGTGGVTGVYYPSGGAICKVVNSSRTEHGVRCSVETTLGSIANIEKLRSGDIDFGYVQSDWQHHAFEGTSLFEQTGKFEELRSVFSLHAEVATIVVRADYDFRQFDDLRGSRISVGDKGSGSAASWEILAERMNWEEEHLRNLTHLNSSEVAEALCSDRIDAYFVLIGHPAVLVDETKDQCDIRLIGIEGAALDELADETPYYQKASIPAGLYGLQAPVESFGVVATFVTSAKMPDEIVYTLVASVFENFQGFKNSHPAFGQLSADDMIAFATSAPLHPGALKFYRERGLLP